MSIATFASKAQIISTENFSEIEAVLAKADYNTLVVFDHSDVLIKSIDNFFLELYKNTRHNELNQIVCPPCVAITENTKLTQLLDNKWPSTISRLQTTGIKTVLLTVCKVWKNGRTGAVNESRYNTLRSFNIDFKRSWPNLKKMIFFNVPRKYDLHNNFYDPFFVNGMLFCGGSQKGHVLRAFLSTIPQYIFTKIIFFDNKRQHLESVEKTAIDLGMQFIGVEYTKSGIKSRTQKLEKEAQSHWRIQG